MKKIKEKSKAKAKKLKEDIIRHKVFLSILIALVLFLGINYYNEGFTHMFLHSDTSEIVDYFDNFGSFASVVFVLFIVLEVVLISVIPSILLYVTGGIIFGTSYGVILILIGNIIGASICFFLSKYFLKDYFEAKIPPRALDKFHKYTDKYGAYALFLLRLNPFTSSDVFSYVAGITRMRYWSFIISTFLGLVPLVIFTVYIGADLVANNDFLMYVFVIGGLLYVLAFVYLLAKPKVKS